MWKLMWITHGFKELKPPPAPPRGRDENSGAKLSNYQNREYELYIMNYEL
jgi:hypothetical protein